MHASIVPVTVLAITCGSTAVASAKPARLLTMKKAERAIDLAWQAELAGDYSGARAALESVVRTATRSAETPGRKRIDRWLRTMAARESSFRAHGKSVRGYAVAHETMRGFGIRRSNMLWRSAQENVPAIAASVAHPIKVALSFEQVRGMDENASVLGALGAYLGRHEISVVQNGDPNAEYEIRIHLDASDIQELAREFRATAEVSAVVWDRRSRRSIGSVAKRRTERRWTEAEARGIAVRQALDHAGEAVILTLRTGVLRALGDPSGRPFDSASDVRSN